MHRCITLVFNGVPDPSLDNNLEKASDEGQYYHELPAEPIVILLPSGDIETCHAETSSNP
jgi:hypothetical protein